MVQVPLFNVKFYEQKYQTFSHGQYLFVQISPPKEMWKIFEITCYLWNIKWLGSTLPYNRFSMNVHLHKLLNSRDTQKTRPKNKAKKEWLMFLQSTGSKFESNNYNRVKNIFFFPKWIILKIFQNKLKDIYWVQKPYDISKPDIPRGLFYLLKQLF